MRPKCLLLFSLMLSAFFSHAATFTVTSKAEQGAGTFTEALQNAAANGTAETDYIVFNLPGTTEDDRTIFISKTLPNVTSNVEIDGTTQPGSFFGVSNAKVRLRWSTNKSHNEAFLYFTYAENIKIFGLEFQLPQNNDDPSLIVYGIHFDGCHHITIGAPGKGNYMAGVSIAISTSFYYMPGSNEDYGQSSDVTIQGNIIGLDPSGGHNQFFGNDFYIYPGKGIQLSNTKDITIGGEASGEGNCIFAIEAFNWSSKYNDNGFLKIINNKINTDVTGTIKRTNLNTTVFTHLNITGSNSFLNWKDIHVLIKGNTLVGSIRLSDIPSYFTIQSNKLFSTRLGGEGEPLIHVNNSRGIIGGETEAEGNEIYCQEYSNRGSDEAAVDGYYDTIEMRHNHIYCNKMEGTPVFPGSESGVYYQPKTAPWVVTDLQKPGYVEGRACSGCRVDVYQDDDCQACEGVLLLGTVTADDNGKWSYSGSFTGTVVAMATNSLAGTSGFSAPWVNNNKYKIVQPDCHLSNGSIKGITLEGADRFTWKQIAFTPVGEKATVITTEHLDLENLAPGVYELSPGFGSTCNGVSSRYILTDQTFTINEANKRVTQPSCGQNNGIIAGITVAAADYSNHDYKSLEWKEMTTNTVVGTSAYIDKLFPGSYKLYVTNNGGCVDSSDVYTLINQSGPTLVTSPALVSNETCGAANGSITNITVSNAKGASSFQWEDDKGTVFSNNADLQKVSAGMYRLKYKDESGCGTITTNYFTIANDGAIGIDETGKQVKASSCAVADGAITGLLVTGGNSYEWINTSGNTKVANGNRSDLLNVPAGSYQLAVSNGFGCKETSSVIDIKQSSFASLPLSSLAYGDASCDAASGYIHPQLSQPVSGYSFQWIDSLSQAIISNSVNADQLAASQYYLMATDANRCKEKIASQTILQLGKPLIDGSRASLAADVCHTSTGSIDHVQVSGGQGGYQWNWFLSPGRQMSTHASTITSLPEGVYYATVTDKEGCSATSETFTINNNAVDMPVPVLSVSDVSAGAPAVIKINNPGAGVYQLYRSPTDLQPAATSTTNSLTTPAITEDGTWYVRNINGDCVSDFAKANIAIIRKTHLAIPSAFSPNNDGVNDYWYIGWQGTVTHYQLSVYDRYGKRVYTSNDIFKGWDGKLNGATLNSGSYVYIITLTDNDGKPQQVTGMVTLVY